MFCIHGHRECDGCMDCYEPAPTIICPNCEEEISLDDTIYTNNIGDIIGCEHCLHEESAEAWYEARQDD